MDVPGTMPETTPVVDPIVATDVVPLLQIPPPKSVRSTLAPGQTWSGPLIKAGIESTIMGMVDIQVASIVTE